MLRVVTSAFGTGAEWENEFFEQMGKGWTPFFDNLRMYLTDFPGQKVTSLSVDAQVPGPGDAVWTALRNSLGARAIGESVDRRGVPARVERLSADPQELLLRLEGSVPGYIGMSAFDMGEGETLTRIEGYLFSDDAPAYVERESTRAGRRGSTSSRSRRPDAPTRDRRRKPGGDRARRAECTDDDRDPADAARRAPRRIDVTGIALMFPTATDEEWAKREATWVDSDSVTTWDGDRYVGKRVRPRSRRPFPGGARLPFARSRASVSCRRTA